MKKLTERQAWLKLAKACADPVACIMYKGYFRVRCVCNTVGHNGLCTAISCMTARQETTDEVLRQIMQKIKTKICGKIFGWPATKKGFASRAAFCRTQAQKLTKKKGGKRALAR